MIQFADEQAAAAATCWFVHLNDQLSSGTMKISLV